MPMITTHAQTELVDDVSDVAWYDGRSAYQETGIGLKRGTRTNPNIWNFVSAHTPVVRVGKKIPLQGISAPSTSMTQKGGEPRACACVIFVSARCAF